MRDLGLMSYFLGLESLTNKWCYLYLTKEVCHRHSNTIQDESSLPICTLIAEQVEMKK